MHDQAPIRCRVEAGEPLRAVARELGVSRNTVRRAVRGGAVYSPERARLDELEPAIAETLARWPLMPAAGVARRLGWSGSMSAFGARVRACRGRVAA